MTPQDPTPARVQLRPITWDDAPGIAALAKRNGIGELDLSIWTEYPLAHEFDAVPAGWVLETGDGEIVGFLGNVHQMYEFAGRRLKAAIATNWMVDAAHRAKALQLVLTFYKQKDIDLYLNGSASPVATKVLAGLKIPRMPIPDYATPCFWAVRPRGFARAVLRRKKIAAPGLLSLLAGPALGIYDLLRSSGRGAQTVAVERATRFDAAFDDLWPRLSAGSPRLRAVRTAAVLHWKYGRDLAAGNAIVLVAGPRQHPSGYAVLIRRDGSELGMEMLEMADLQAAGDDPQIYTSLILAAIQTAREEGADALRLVTGTPSKRRPALALKPYTYELPFWQLYAKVPADLTEALAPADTWDFSRFETY